MNKLRRTQEKPHLICVSMEFDESSKKTRLRSGMLDVEATYPILVTWQSHQNK
jgi:hypothetical protein